MVKLLVKQNVNLQEAQKFKYMSLYLLEGNIKLPSMYENWNLTAK